jgi:threonine dehydrogenase-like Zn-dependent dehydrogenase
MRAAVFYDVEDIRVEDVPEPTIAEDEVLVEVAACGFCGSDVEYYYGKSPVGTATGKGPLVLGHEFSGRVVGLGKLAGGYGLAEGDRVAVCPIQSCGACDSCRGGRPQFCVNLSVLGVTTDGGFAQFAKTKAAHAYKLPDTLTDAQGAFVEMLAAAVNAVRKAEVEPDDFAVVYGPGPVGLSMVQLLKNAGARVGIVGTGGYRLDVARALGADVVFDAGDDLAERIQEANGGRLADRVLVATGSMAANQQALEISGPGSTVIFMGVTGPQDAVQVPMLTSLIQDKTIRFSLWYPFQWPRTIGILAHEELDTGPIITHSAPLEGIGDAIARVVNREDGVLKTVITP